MSSFKKLKKGIIIVTGVYICIAFSACSNSDSNSDTSTDNKVIRQEESAKPSKEPVKEDTSTKVEIKDSSQIKIQFKSVDKVNESDYVAILNKGGGPEHFALSADADVKKVALCEANYQEDSKKFEVGEEIEAKENLGENEKVCIDIVVVEGIPNKMIVITCNDNKIKKYIICYNGKDGGADLKPEEDE